jgi:hypothetical protein
MKLRVGHIDYELKTTKTTTRVRKKDVTVGYCDFQKKLITIREDQPDTEFNATVVHEVLHALSDAHRFGWKLPKEERIVETLEGPLLTLIRDNPEFFAKLAVAARDGTRIEI